MALKRINKVSIDLISTFGQKRSRFIGSKIKLGHRERGECGDCKGSFNYFFLFFVKKSYLCVLKWAYIRTLFNPFDPNVCLTLNFLMAQYGWPMNHPLRNSRLGKKLLCKMVTVLSQDRSDSHVIGGYLQLHKMFIVEANL